MREPMTIDQLPVVDESLFYRLLEGPGLVQVDIIMFEHCFLPYVSFSACSDMPTVHYGVTLRNGTAPIAANTEAELIMQLRDMADDRKSLQISLTHQHRFSCNEARLYSGHNSSSASIS